jgi:TetR/AcrR family transcriptional repressor of bet genes
VARAAERVAVDRRAQILDAARAVMSRQGYAETSMKDIAREAGVAPGLLHYYFDSKEEILLEVVSDLSHEILESKRYALDASADPLEAVALAIEKAAERCSPNFCRLLLDAYSLALNNAAFRERLLPGVQEGIDSTARTAEELSGNISDVPSPVPTADLALAINGAMDGISLLATLRGEDPAGGFRAMKAMLLAYVALAYQAAGKEVPLSRLFELILR